MCSKISTQNEIHKYDGQFGGYLTDLEMILPLQGYIGAPSSLLDLAIQLKEVLTVDSLKEHQPKPAMLSM